MNEVRCRKFQIGDLVMLDPNDPDNIRDIPPNDLELSYNKVYKVTRILSEFITIYVREDNEYYKYTRFIYLPEQLKVLGHSNQDKVLSILAI